MSCGNPVNPLVLVVGAIVVLVVLLFLGLCLASLFLPAILALVGIVMIWKGSQSNQVLMFIGIFMIVGGALLWVWQG